MSRRVRRLHVRMGTYGRDSVTLVDSGEDIAILAHGSGERFLVSRPVLRLAISRIEQQDDRNATSVVLLKDGAGAEHRLLLDRDTTLELVALVDGEELPARRPLGRKPGRPGLGWLDVARLVLAGALVLVAAVFLGSWVAGERVDARVDRVVTEGEGADAYTSCEVSWTGGDSTGSGVVECWDPPRTGEPLAVHVLGPPFAGKAFDLEGSFWFALLPPLVGAAVVGAGSLLRAVPPSGQRMTSTATRLSSVMPAPRSADPSQPVVGWGMHLDAPDHSTTPGLLLRLAAREGWVDELPGTPRAVSPADVVRRELVRPHTVVPAAALTVSLTAALLTGAAAAWALVAPLVVVLLVVLLLAGARVRALVAPFSDAFGRELGYASELVPGAGFRVYLLEGSVVLGELCIPDGPCPGVEGRCLVRGELRDGAALHLRIADQVWVPVGTFTAYDRDARAALRRRLFRRLAATGAVLPDGDGIPSTT